MSNLIQIVYVSRSTFKSSTSGNTIEPNIARILAKSRSNNRKNGLVGVLYFGDGCFFQCLEGDALAIDTLYSKLEADPRHQELKLISRKQITQLSFSAWSMKYIPAETQIQKLLKKEGLESFDPYRFSEGGTQEMLALLHQASDPEDEKLPADLGKTRPDIAKTSAPAISSSAPEKQNKTVLVVVGVVIIAALLLAYFLR